MKRANGENYVGVAVAVKSFTRFFFFSFSFTSFTVRVQCSYMHLKRTERTSE